jgi:hypothetical protein
MEFPEPDLTATVTKGYGKPKVVYVRPKTIRPPICNSREDALEYDKKNTKKIYDEFQHFQKMLDGKEEFPETEGSKSQNTGKPNKGPVQKLS